MFGQFARSLFGRSTPSPAAALRKRGASTSYLDRYDREFAPLLGVRAEGFRVMFSLLEQRCRALDGPALIVETGSVRAPGQWENDGQSTVLWDDFARYYDAEIHSVDLDPAPARLIRAELSAEVHAHTGDSVRFLHELACQSPARRIDLLYLDSLDVDANNPFLSAFHHVKELAAARPCIGPGSIIAVDDNVPQGGGGFSGKGFLVADWFEQIGIPRAYTGYQFIWQM